MTAHLRLDPLEPRWLPTADFGFALGCGNGLYTNSADRVATEAAANTYLTGAVKATVDFDPSPSEYLLNGDDYSHYVAKDAPAGALIWAQNLGANSSTGEAVPIGLAVDGAGNV